MVHQVNGGFFGSGWRRHRTTALISLLILASAALTLWWSGFTLSGLKVRRGETNAVSRGSQVPPDSVAAHVISIPSLETNAAVGGLNSSLSKVALPLVLIGATPGLTPYEGTAQLGPDARSPQTYAVGALLENGARLIEIHRDHVVLEKSGSHVNLYLNGTVSVSNAEAAEAAKLLATVGGRKAQVMTRPTSVDSLSTSLRAQPAYENDKLVGFEVYPGRPGRGFAEMGLKPGDVVRFRDGKQLTSDVEWRQIEALLLSGSTAQISIVREGQLVHLSLDGSLIQK